MPVSLQAFVFGVACACSCRQTGLQTELKKETRRGNEVIYCDNNNANFQSPTQFFLAYGTLLVMHNGCICPLSLPNGWIEIFASKFKCSVSAYLTKNGFKRFVKSHVVK